MKELLDHLRNLIIVIAFTGTEAPVSPSSGVGKIEK